jgi:hypothetical protein
MLRGKTGVCFRNLSSWKHKEIIAIFWTDENVFSHPAEEFGKVHFVENFPPNRV